MSFLLDTNAIAEPLKPRPHAGFMTRLREHGHELAIAAVTWHEAIFGLERLAAGRRREAIRDYLYDVLLRSCEILPYDSRAAEWHARERARLLSVGRTAPFVDSQIAATAVVHGRTLVTANVRDFGHFVDLQVTNWRAR